MIYGEFLRSPDKLGRLQSLLLLCLKEPKSLPFFEQRLRWAQRKTVLPPLIVSSVDRLVQRDLFLPDPEQPFQFFMFVFVLQLFHQSYKSPFSSTASI